MSNLEPIDKSSSCLTYNLFGNNEFSEKEHQAIQTVLRQKLGPEFISQRVGPGGQKLAYIEGWRLINLANETFGFNGWSHSVSQQTVDFVDHIDGRYYVGVSAIVRVQLKDGSYHEDIGYGVCEGMKSKALAIEKARKESVTDGLKRALKSYGNSFGNCLGDRNYLKCISRSSKLPAVEYNIEDMKRSEVDESITTSRFSRTDCRVSYNSSSKSHDYNSTSHDCSINSSSKHIKLKTSNENGINCIDGQTTLCDEDNFDDPMFWSQSLDKEAEKLCEVTKHQAHLFRSPRSRTAGFQKRSSPDKRKFSAHNGGTSKIPDPMKKTRMSTPSVE